MSPAGVLVRGLHSPNDDVAHLAHAISGLGINRAGDLASIVGPPSPVPVRSLG